MDSASENCDKSKPETVSQKKEIPPNLQKICLVCGDKALGYNFNVISCESCKAFFRRNALTDKEFKCPFTNNCEITTVTRRFCQKCRLEKCLAVGMVKEFIMSEEDKAQKRRKIEENRAKKRSNTEQDDGVSSSKNFKKDSDTMTDYIPARECTAQYDVLNSTSCSPNSTVQSPLSNEMDLSLQSPPVYSHYTHGEIPYMKAYPTEEHPLKSMINRSLYEQRNTIDQYTMCDSLDNSMYADSPKPSSIRSRTPEREKERPDSCGRDPKRLGCPTGRNHKERGSLLTNGDFPAYPETKPRHICEEIPSTSSDPDVNKARDILQDVERIEPNSMESILCEAIKLEFEAYTSINPCGGSSRELNEVERAKLNELIVANKALHAPIDDALSQLIGDTANTELKEGSSRHDPRLITIVNLTAIAIRRFIKMAKRINAFRNMCEEDQVAVLKGGCIEMMILRSTMTYDGQKNTWKLPHSQEQYGSIRTDVLKLAKGNIYRSYEAFISTFDPRWRSDEHIILIMSAIVMFTPRARVVHRDVIKLEQNSYYYLLRRYLESVYPGCEAKSTFLKLIQKILEIRKFADEVTGVYLDVNPIEPLLMEIFDLKHHGA